MAKYTVCFSSHSPRHITCLPPRSSRLGGYPPGPASIWYWFGWKPAFWVWSIRFHGSRGSAPAPLWKSTMCALQVKHVSFLQSNFAAFVIWDIWYQSGLCIPHIQYSLMFHKVSAFIKECLKLKWFRKAWLLKKISCSFTIVKFPF